MKNKKCDSKPDLDGIIHKNTTKPCSFANSLFFNHITMSELSFRFIIFQIHSFVNQCKKPSVPGFEP